ncbi:MAG: nucleotidyltransferase domain-containing protein [Candidatus Cloacimonetes bacterium]|nr:nucleotidyltransferase domain-containing protein [Candidatus Cloacimonadota bacterium]
MKIKPVTAEKLMSELNERAKELNCLYNVEAVLQDLDADLGSVFSRLLEVIHPGWQYNDICQARIRYQGKEWTTGNFRESSWFQQAKIRIGDEEMGLIEVFYISNPGPDNLSPFLQEEQKLLDSIAAKLSVYLFHQKFRAVFGQWEKAQRIISKLEKKEGRILRILQNSSADEILEYLESPSQQVNCPEELEIILSHDSAKHWSWRWNIAQVLARDMDPARFGVAGLYIFGSTKNGTAGPASDIDLIIHIRATSSQIEELKAWLDGWSCCLSEINFWKTGYRTAGLLDYHLVTDEDIRNQTSYASKIKAISDGARPLPLGSKKDS